MALLDDLPDRVSVYEVSPRDGLQNEAAAVGTIRKLRLVEALVAAGLKRIEVTSFVAPGWIPQLADADDLARMLVPVEGVTFSALCPNLRGLSRAMAAGVGEIALFLSASETHNRRNINKSIERTMALFSELTPEAIRQGLRVRAYISTLWGCPYEGEIDPAPAVKLARKLVDLGCYQVSLGDTTGVGTPMQTRDLVQRFMDELAPEAIALHLHDTRGQALANALVGLEMGVRTFDASIAGLGGCPYAPGASGNLATEDLVYMLHNLGIETGIDADKLWEAGRVAEAIVGRELPGRVHRAGLRALDR